MYRFLPTIVFLLVILINPCFALPKPTITTINPTSGPTEGGTTVTIRGSNFDNDIQVYLGWSGCDDIDVSDDGTSLTCVTHSQPADVVDVTVTNPDYQSDTLEDAFTFFNVLPAPKKNGVKSTFDPCC